MHIKMMYDIFTFNNVFQHQMANVNTAKPQLQQPINFKFFTSHCNTTNNIQFFFFFLKGAP